MLHRRAGEGIATALQPNLEGKAYPEAREALRERLGDVALSEAFQRGYARGAAAATDRARELAAGELE